MKYFFSIDIETTGQFLTKNAMIAFGCSIMNENNEEVESFIGFMKVPENRDWEKRCFDEFWSKESEALNYIRDRAEEPKKVMNSFVQWMDKIDLKYGNDLIVLSDNGGYDFAWIDTYLSEYTDRHSIYYRLKEIKIIKDQYENSIVYFNRTEKIYGFRRTWDTNSMYMGVLIERTGKYEEWKLENKVGNQNEIWKNDHNPLNDARNIVSNFIIYYNKNIKKE